MAEVRAVKSGVWSDPTVWSTGGLPAAADDVYSNNFTVTVDQGFSVQSVRNTAGALAVAGGTFTVAAGGLALTAAGAGFVSGATGLLTFSGAGALTLNGNTAAGTGGAALTVSGGGTLTHNGNVIAGSNSTAVGVSVVTTGGATVNVNGNVTGGSVTSAVGISAISGVANATVFVSGTVSGGSGGTTSYGVNLTVAGSSLQVGTSGVPGAIVSTSAVGVNCSVPVVVWGPVTASGSNTALSCSSTVTVHGTVTGTAGVGLSWTGTTTCSIFGDVVAGANVGLSVGIGSSGTVSVTGNVLGGSGASTHGISIITANSVSVSVTGNCTGGSSTGHGLSNAGAAATATITGNCMGGSSSSACGASNSSSGSITIFGDAIGGSTATNYGAQSTGTGAVTLWGTARGSNSGTGAGNGMHIGSSTNCFAQVVQGNDYPNSGLTVASVGVTGTSAAAVFTCDAMVDGSGGYPGTQTVRSFMRPAGNNYVSMRDGLLGNVVMMGEATDYPTPADVRDGVSYNFGAQHGTCKVPPATSVLSGVPVDNTVGSGSLSPAALLGEDLLARLQQCATVETTGHQLAALGTPA